MKRKKKKKPVERTLLKPFSSLSEVCRLETESNVEFFSLEESRCDIVYLQFKFTCNAIW